MKDISKYSFQPNPDQICKTQFNASLTCLRAMASCPL